MFNTHHNKTPPHAAVEGSHFGVKNRVNISYMHRTLQNAELAITYHIAVSEMHLRNYGISEFNANVDRSKQLYERLLALNWHGNTDSLHGTTSNERRRGRPMMAIWQLDTFCCNLCVHSTRLLCRRQAIAWIKTLCVLCNTCIR